ncbi:hypothetical protein [Lentibacillus sp.]|uniref:hypothetical protein n=1 Tax=Lentibacillus sp. TaxID=1925746 RepID=UPI002B4B79C3|nr:hypothetical protein [Lentibacillus sp.]HLS10189.1 hypothetical protein [Lentibacillus sp.]
MKNAIIFIITLVAVALANLAVASVFHISFLDASFLVGLFAVVILYYVNSSSSPFTKSINADIQGETGTKVKTESRYFKKGVSFFAALFYLIGAAVITLIVYWDLFF